VEERLEEPMQLIQVLYRNNRGGPVDDITLDELIRSRKITHFYRSSEDRWIDIFVDPVRGRGHADGAEGPKRRFTDEEGENGQGAPGGKSGGLFRGVFTRLAKHPPLRALTAGGWLERGLSTRRNTDDRLGAARAFALSIRLDPRHQEAYLHRGLVYEELGNFQQAIEDYGMAIALDPKEGTHRARGLLLGRPDVTVKAIAGLRRAADLQRASSHLLLASPAELRETLKAFTAGRHEQKAGVGGDEGFPGIAGNLQRLIEKYRKEITQLETQLQGVRHKRDILVEASRLLEEDAGLSAVGNENAECCASSRVSMRRDSCDEATSGQEG